MLAAVLVLLFPILVSSTLLAVYVRRCRTRARRAMGIRKLQRSWMRPMLGSRRAYESIAGVVRATTVGRARVLLEFAWWASARDVRRWAEEVRVVGTEVELRRVWH